MSCLSVCAALLGPSNEAPRKGWLTSCWVPGLTRQATQEGESGLTSQKLKLREAKGLPKVPQPGSRHYPAFWQFQKCPPAPGRLAPRAPNLLGRASSAWGKGHRFFMILAALRTISISRRSQNCAVFGPRPAFIGFSAQATVAFTPGTWASILALNGGWSPADEGLLLPFPLREVACGPWLVCPAPSRQEASSPGFQAPLPHSGLVCD